MSKTHGLTTLKQLVALYGRDERYWSGYLDGMNLVTVRAAKNAKAVDETGFKRLARQLAVQGHAGPRKP